MGDHAQRAEFLMEADWPFPAVQAARRVESWIWAAHASVLGLARSAGPPGDLFGNSGVSSDPVALWHMVTGGLYTSSQASATASKLKRRFGIGTALVRRGSATGRAARASQTRMLEASPWPKTSLPNFIREAGSHGVTRLPGNVPRTSSTQVRATTVLALRHFNKSLVDTSPAASAPVGEALGCCGSTAAGAKAQGSPPSGVIVATLKHPSWGTPGSARQRRRTDRAGVLDAIATASCSMRAL